MPYGGETFVDLAQLLAAMRVVAALFGFIFSVSGIQIMAMLQRTVSRFVFVL